MEQGPGIDCSRTAQSCWHPPTVLCSGTIWGLLGFPINRDESNLAAASSQNTAAAPSPCESRLLAQTDVTVSFMLESWRPEQLMTVYISLL